MSFEVAERYRHQGDNCATFLTSNLNSNDVMICLGLGATDTVMAPCSEYVPNRQRQIFTHPSGQPDRPSGDIHPPYGVIIPSVALQNFSQRLGSIDDIGFYL
jgi:hypothetical protein